jgi:diacylglycerol kinase (ATP)
MPVIAETLAPVTPSWVGTSTLLVANPAAAGYSTQLLADVSELLTGAGATVEVAITSSPGDASTIANEARHRHPDAAPDVIVLLGGDGTVHEVVAGLLTSARGAVRPVAPAVLVLPAGSGNSTAINLWGRQSPRAIVQGLLSEPAWRRRPIDVLHLVEPALPVVLGASTGFLAQVLVDALKVEGATGLERYLTAAGQVIAAPPVHSTRVTVDGAVLADGPTTVVAVGGGRIRAAAYEFLPHSEWDDGLLDVCVIDALDAAAVLELSDPLARGAHLDDRRVHYGQGRRVVIEREDGHHLVSEYDGNVLEAPGPRLTVELWPVPLDLVVPLAFPCSPTVPVDLPLKEHR